MCLHHLVLLTFHAQPLSRNHCPTKHVLGRFNCGSGQSNNRIGAAPCMACLPEYGDKLLAGTIFGWVAMAINLLVMVPLSCWLLCVYNAPEHTAWTDGTHLQLARDDDLIQMEDSIAHIGSYEGGTATRLSRGSSNREAPDTLPQMGDDAKVDATAVDAAEEYRVYRQGAA